MLVQTETRYTPEAYLELEVASEERHEYINGAIIPMTGGSPNHNKIALNLSATLLFQLKRKPYDIYVTDQRLWIFKKRMHTYPDVMVLGQPIAYTEGRRDTLTDPILVAEVLSTSTRNYGQGGKFAAYHSIPTFQEYLLIDQYDIHVKHYFKTANRRWTFAEYEVTDTLISLQSIGCDIELVDLYNKVEFDTADKQELPLD